MNPEVQDQLKQNVEPYPKNIFSRRIISVLSTLGPFFSCSLSNIIQSFHSVHIILDALHYLTKHKKDACRFCKNTTARCTGPENLQVLGSVRDPGPRQTLTGSKLALYLPITKRTITDLAYTSDRCHFRQLSKLIFLMIEEIKVTKLL